MSFLWEHLPGASKKEAIKAAHEATEKATRWLWIMRVDLWLAIGPQVKARSPPGHFAWVRLCDVSRSETPSDPNDASLMMRTSASKRCVIWTANKALKIIGCIYFFIIIRNKINAL